MSEKYIRVSELGFGHRNPDVFNDPERAHGWNELLRIVQSAPTYTPADILSEMWVPVTEKLPEEIISDLTRVPVEYPCIYRSKVNGKREVRYYQFANGHFYHGPEVMDDNIEAWARPLSLPEPPKEAT